MPLQRKITAIKLVQRIKQHEIDGLAAKLATIRVRQATLHDEIDNLMRLRDREGHATTPEAAPYLAGFLRAIKARCDFLTEQLAELDHDAADIELQLYSAFIELKANDSALSQAEKEVRLGHERAETAATEEVARIMYLRRRRKAGIAH
jgi:hypothetical protein